MAGALPDVLEPDMVEIFHHVPAGELVSVRLSHYWPPLGGPNCFRFVAGQCLSPTASGEPWQDWIGTGAACVPEWPFGTTLTLPGGETFTCVDRGGKIKTVAGVPWVDLLVQRAPVPFGTVVDARVVWP
jgi:hypothetical protein